MNRSPLNASSLIAILLSLGACKERGQITVVNPLPTAVTITAQGQTEPLGSGESKVFRGDVGDSFWLKAKIEGCDLTMTIEYAAREFKSDPQTFPANLASNYFYLQVINNSNKTYGHVDFEVANPGGYHKPCPVTIDPHQTVGVSYFSVEEFFRFIIGTSSTDLNPVIFRYGIDFTLPETDNQVVTLTIN